MNDDRAKSVILRRWRDASARRQNCREIGLFNAADKENAAKKELASLFRELYPGEDILISAADGPSANKEPNA